MSMIHIGTSGFSFPDWMSSVYPADLNKDSLLPYYEQQLGFNTVELNFTYYAIPSFHIMENMNKKTSKEFRFIVKGFKGITHDPFDPRLKLKPSKDKVKEYFNSFCKSMEIFTNNKKLAGVLLQFPVFFIPTEETREYILKAKDMLLDIPLIVEFRNSKWNEEANFEFLKKHKIAYCAVDEPDYKELMPFVNEITSSDIAYLRFHGRSKEWFSSTVEKRYDYLYTKEELKEFVPEIRKMENSTKNVYVFFNNCHGGKAATNAKMMRDMLGLPFDPVQKDLF
ncbi:DUF72 domain-containing protein [Elusimicrobiota bacterium]